MKIKSKLRVLLAFYASIPILAIWLGALKSGITKLEAFQYAYTAGVASYLIILLFLPLF